MGEDILERFFHNWQESMNPFVIAGRLPGEKSCFNKTVFHIRLNEHDVLDPVFTLDGNFSGKAVT
jgi:hypothetical protein